MRLVLTPGPSGVKGERVQGQGQQCADEPEGTIHAHGDVSRVTAVKATTPGGTATMNVRVLA